MIKLAGMWDGIKDGVPYLNPSWAKIEDPELKQSILGFLRGGSSVLAAPGWDADWLDPKRPQRVPIEFRTDGNWIWSAKLAYYLEHHNVSPSPEFMDHMRSFGFHARKPSDAQLQQAIERLKPGEQDRSAPGQQPA